MHPEVGNCACHSVPTHPTPGPTLRPEKLSSRATNTGCSVLWLFAKSGRLEAPAEDRKGKKKSECLITVLTPPLCYWQ